jgi:hypothetical protein
LTQRRRERTTIAISAPLLGQALPFVLSEPISRVVDSRIKKILDLRNQSLTMVDAARKT